MKDRIQKEGINKWYQAGCNGTLEYATGVGKSRCGVLAAGWLVKSKPDASILILTPTQTIRDQAWIAEFKKWEHIISLKIMWSVCVYRLHISMKVVIMI